MWCVPAERELLVNTAVPSIASVPVPRTSPSSESIAGPAGRRSGADIDDERGGALVVTVAICGGLGFRRSLANGGVDGVRGAALVVLVAVVARADVMRASVERGGGEDGGPVSGQ